MQIRQNAPEHVDRDDESHPPELPGPKIHVRLVQQNSRINLQLPVGQVHLLHIQSRDGIVRSQKG